MLVMGSFQGFLIKEHIWRHRNSNMIFSFRSNSKLKYCFIFMYVIIDDFDLTDNFLEVVESSCNTLIRLQTCGAFVIIKWWVKNKNFNRGGFLSLSFKTTFYIRDIRLDGNKMHPIHETTINIHVCKIDLKYTWIHADFTYHETRDKSSY